MSFPLSTFNLDSFRSFLKSLRSPHNTTKLEDLDFHFILLSLHSFIYSYLLVTWPPIIFLNSHYAMYHTICQSEICVALIKNNDSSATIKKSFLITVEKILRNKVKNKRQLQVDSLIFCQKINPIHTLPVNLRSYEKTKSFL